MAPPNPQVRFQRLPPILRISAPLPVPNCSKAPRGLFVLPRVNRIFTVNSISPDPPSRQCPDRYAFRAGRNLPDKEFRYLRTVIVTAAVHRGFNSRREPLLLTFRHWAGVSPYTSLSRLQRPVVLINSRLGLLSAAPRCFGSKFLHTQGRSFSRSYGSNLPSSLTKVLPFPLWYLPSPTSVGLRYGRNCK